MDFELDADQRAILEAVEALLAQHAGPERAIALQAKGEYDSQLDAALGEAGFTDVARAEETGPLEAGLVVEAVARAGGVAAIGAEALVVPGIGTLPLPGPVALVEAGHAGPVRFGAHARTLLLADGDRVRAIGLDRGESAPVPSNFGYPMGRLPAALGDRGEVITGDGGVDLGERMRSWWRVALAFEAVGTMRAALEVTVGYLRQRRQFGRTIGSFQAVQHRLASLAIEVEGSGWLVREAAYLGAPQESAATAAAYALAAAGRVFSETHQLSGAIGFTREHDLHVWSMRLHALRLELAGVPGHRRAIATARWGARA